MAVLALAAEHPVPAAVAAGVILLVGLVLFALVFAQIRRGVGVVRRNLARLRSGGAGL